mgnify:CR=1 FL=1
MAYAQRGLDRGQEQSMAAVLRDTRTIAQKLDEFLKNPYWIFCIIFVSGATGIVFTAISDIMFIFSLIIFCWICNKPFNN